ncbi:MAG TPA: helicase-associated domain-containing protein [Ktedonobacteraceae bacterium]|nr:helicase-associated domain-containing protein [Ktedonobacteraceae bacterium]
MADISLMSLKKKLEQERKLIPLVAQIWEAPEQENNWNTMTLILKYTQNGHAARSVWEALSPQERLCLFYLFGSGNPDKLKGMTLENVGQQTKLSSESVAEAVESLRTRWYLVERATPSVVSSPKSKSSRLAPAPALERVFLPYRECFEQLWQVGQEIFQSDEDRSTFSLEHLVKTYTGDRLSSLANHCHVPLYYGMYPSSSSSNASQLKAVYERIYEALSHPLMPFELLNKLEPLTQEIFFWLCEQGGKVKMAEVRPYIAARTQTQGAFLSVVSTLESHALVFDTFTSDGTRWLFTPADLLVRVEREVQERTEEEQRFAFSPLDDTEAVPESQPLLLYDVAVAIGTSTQMVIEPTKDGRVPKRLRGKIRPFLHGRARLGDSLDDIHIDQVFRTALRMGLLEAAAPAEEEKNRYLRGPKLDSWSELSPIEQARAFLQWWRATPHWADARSDGKVVYSSIHFHERLVDHLKQCVPERWYRIDVLLYALFRQRPLPLFHSYTKAFARPTPLRTQREIWMEQEAKTYISPLASFLSELGIVSMQQQPQATQEDTGLFCVTAFGAAVLGSTPAQPDPPAQATEQPLLVVQPNFEVFAMQFDTKLVYQLLTTAELVRIGRVSTFRLTESSILTGLRNSMRLEETLTLLAAHTPQKTLPQNVVYTIKDWAKTYREFHLSEVFFVETLENETQESLHRLVGKLPIELRQIGPGNFLVLPKTHVTFGDLRKRLRQAGIEVRGEPLSTLGKRI